jgi:hypothetical protein
VPFPLGIPFPQERHVTLRKNRNPYFSVVNLLLLSAQDRPTTASTDKQQTRCPQHQGSGCGWIQPRKSDPDLAELKKSDPMQP